MLSSEISEHHLPDSGNSELEVHQTEGKHPTDHRPCNPQSGPTHAHGDFRRKHHIENNNRESSFVHASSVDSCRSNPGVSRSLESQSACKVKHTKPSSKKINETKTSPVFKTKPSGSPLNTISPTATEWNGSRNDNIITSKNSKVHNHFQDYASCPPQNHPNHPTSIQSHARHSSPLPSTNPSTREEFSRVSSQMLNHADSAATPPKTLLTTQVYTSKGGSNEGTTYFNEQPSQQTTSSLVKQKPHALETPISVTRIYGTPHFSSHVSILANNKQDVHHLGVGGPREGGGEVAYNTATHPVPDQGNSDCGNSADSLIRKRQCQLDDLPLELRNKKMRPAECLLFAAALIKENYMQSDDDIEGKAPSIASKTPVEISASVSAPSHIASYKMSPVADQDDSKQGLIKPRDVDVLCGRGGLINKHPGNIVYRKVVDYNKPFYQSVHKKHRILVSQSIVQSILNFGGRFLILGGAKGKPWVEIDFKKAVQKTSQALRERGNLQDCDQNTKSEEDRYTNDQEQGDEESHSDGSNHYDDDQNYDDGGDSSDHDCNGSKFEAL